MGAEWEGAADDGELLEDGDGDGEGLGAGVCECCAPAAAAKAAEETIGTT
jgi:hypothetical protein